MEEIKDAKYFSLKKVKQLVKEVEKDPSIVKELVKLTPCRSAQVKSVPSKIPLLRSAPLMQTLRKSIRLKSKPATFRIVIAFAAAIEKS